MIYYVTLNYVDFKTVSYLSHESQCNCREEEKECDLDILRHCLGTDDTTNTNIHVVPGQVSITNYIYHKTGYTCSITGTHYEIF